MNKEKTNKAIDLDKINNERVETTLKRVSHALKLISNPIGCLKDNRVIDNCEKDIAHAVNILETAVEEMRWACEHFEWNDDVCMLIDDAIASFGSALAWLHMKDDEDYDVVAAWSEAKDGQIALGKVIATLIRWFDDDQDTSEI